MASVVVNSGALSLWRRIARIVGGGILGGVALALTGFLEGLIAFPAFVAVHEAIYPPETHGRVFMTALHSGLPVVLAFLGASVGGVTIAILSILAQGSESIGRYLRLLLKGALAGTTLGVIVGVLGGLALGWSRMPTQVGLFSGYFYGACLGFVLGLVVSLVSTARRYRVRSREPSDVAPGRGRQAPSLPWRIATAALAAGYVAVCAGVLVFKQPSDAPAVTAREARIAKATLTRKGQLAPAFLVTDTDGKTFDSGSKRGGPVLVNFFATWCGPCQSELARLEPEIWQRYRDRGLTVLVIGVGEQARVLSEFRTKRGLSVPFAADPDRQVFTSFATDTIPRNYLIRADGRIVYQSVGYTEKSFDDLEQAIQRELAQPQ